jgi:hypothetical protein
MAMQQTFEAREGYTLVTVTGERKPNDLTALHQALIEYCRQHTVSRLVVDARTVWGAFSVVTHYQMAQNNRQLTRAGLRYHALVRPEASIDERFYETASLNQGCHLKLFLDLDDAIAWITSANPA